MKPTELRIRLVRAIEAMNHMAEIWVENANEYEANYLSDNGTRSDLALEDMARAKVRAYIHSADILIAAMDGEKIDVIDLMM